jgi:hypothetical protein
MKNRPAAAVNERREPECAPASVSIAKWSGPSSWKKQIIAWRSTGWRIMGWRIMG